MRTHTLDDLANLDVAMAEVESRLVDDLGADRRTAVHNAIEEALHRFDHARIHAFVPILVERSVRSQLS